jgi:hypothetical protein
MHTVNRNMRIIPTNVWRWILEVSDNLIGNQTWIKNRRQYLEHKPSSLAYSSDGAAGLLVWEALNLLNVLTSKEKKLHLGVDPRRRWYTCINCWEKYREQINPDIPDVKTSQLRPADAGSTTLYCFVCDTQYAVIRKKCPNDNCRGDAMDSTDGLCLTCMEAHCEFE